MSFQEIESQLEKVKDNLSEFSKAEEKEERQESVAKFKETKDLLSNIFQFVKHGEYSDKEFEKITEVVEGYLHLAHSRLRYLALYIVAGPKFWGKKYEKFFWDFIEMKPEKYDDYFEERTLGLTLLAHLYRDTKNINVMTKLMVMLESEQNEHIKKSLLNSLSEIFSYSGPRSVLQYDKGHSDKSEQNKLNLIESIKAFLEKTK